jgi:hypothetical protein
MLEHHQIVASLQQQFDGKPNSHAVPAPVRTIHPFSPQVASLYQRWLGKRLFSDKGL